jgi:hypothetical protein
MEPLKQKGIWGSRRLSVEQILLSTRQEMKDSRRVKTPLENRKSENIP